MTTVYRTASSPPCSPRLGFASPSSEKAVAGCISAFHVALATVSEYGTFWCADSGYRRGSHITSAKAQLLQMEFDRLPHSNIWPSFSRSTV